MSTMCPKYYQFSLLNMIKYFPNSIQFHYGPKLKRMLSFPEYTLHYLYPYGCAQFTKVQVCFLFQRWSCIDEFWIKSIDCSILCAVNNSTSVKAQNVKRS
uniref:Uncharacterized protein n=1 Tax=Anguilla anguilla TaxID=7936 RepID=A0A0E9X7Z1_ANGAN